MGIRRTAIDRINEARKSSVPTIGKGKPLDARGNEGDLTFRRTSEGLKLYIKANHKWHGIKVGESFDSLEKKINEIKSKVDTIKQFRLPSIYSVTGDFTLDVSGDIDLDADGGQVAIKDAGDRHFLFDCDNTALTIYDDQDTGDLFKIQIAQHGATTISTVDDDAANANLNMSIDGAITLDAAAGVLLDSGDGRIFLQAAGTTFGNIQVDTTSQIKLYEQGGATSNDYLKIETATHGATTITTHDAAAAAANLTMTIDGGITLDSAGEIVIDHTDRFKFKKAGTEYVKWDVDGASQLTMFEQGGTTTDDYLLVNVATNGATTLQTVDAAGADADLTLFPDGDLILKVGNGGTFMKEAASAATDKLGYGQLWVKNATPNELYFTNAEGADIQITSGSSIAGGGGATKHWMDWYMYQVNMSVLNAYYSALHNDEYGASSSINSDLSTSGYSTTTLNNGWRWMRYARRIPYAGTVTKFMCHLESSGASADSDIEVALWWVDALADDTEHASTVNATCDHLCTLSFDFSSASRSMTMQTTSFNATAVSEGDWFFITMKRTSGTDGSSFHCHPTILWDGS